MAVLTVRNRPDELHRALQLRARQNGRSTAAEVRAILESVVLPPDRVKLGTLLQEMGRRAGLTNEDVDEMERSMARNPMPCDPVPDEQEGDGEVEAVRQKLIAGERGGDPQPFDFAVFSRRKLAQHGA
jgi:plasmid stability protein